MDSDVLFFMLLLIFMAIFAYVFLNCNCRCRCGVIEKFSKCQCANGTPKNNCGRLYGNNDACGSCNDGYNLSGLNWANGKLEQKCNLNPAPTPTPTPAPTPAPAPSPSTPACRDCEDDSRVQYGECQSNGYPKCEDKTSSYKKTSNNNFTLGDKVEVSNQNCDWTETTDSKKIKRYDDKICINATDYIPQSYIESGRGKEQAMTIKNLTEYCNSVPGCYGWARNKQQGDHKVKLCKKNASSTTSLNNNRNYDVYTCNSDYVCPPGYELNFNIDENKYECSICPDGKYKSGKNANNCVPCKSSCDNGKILRGKCVKGSTSDTTTCEGPDYIKKDNVIYDYNTDTDSKTKYDGYHPKRRWSKRLDNTKIEDALKECNEMNAKINDSCGALYEYHDNDNNIKYYLIYSKNTEDIAQKTISIDEYGSQFVDNKNPIGEILFENNMKYKYVRA